MTLTQTITNYKSKDSIGSKLRAKRIKPLLEIIRCIHNKKGRVNLLDIGGTQLYWTILPEGFLEKYNVWLTLVNTSNEDRPYQNERFSFIIADGCDLSLFNDGLFDIAHSNSVIEHVGSWRRKVSFANEIQRVSENYYVQTPNFWFPVEPHCMTPFFHWLPLPLRAYLVMHFKLGYWGKANNIDNAMHTVESACLLTKKMLQMLFPNSSIITERFFLLPKSHTAIYNRSNTSRNSTTS